MNETLSTAITLSRNEAGKLVLHREGEDDVEGVRVTRCFPWSLPGEYISLRDGEGKELHLLRDLSELSAEMQALVQDELGLQDFIPVVTGVESIDDTMEVMEWHVQTDRGPLRLQIKSNDDIRPLDDGRVLIRDHAGGVFQVNDLNAMDETSQRFLLDHMG